MLPVLSERRMLVIVSIAVLWLCAVAVIYNTAQKHQNLMDAGAERVNAWIDTVSGFSPLGNGIGSYWALYPKYATHADTVASRMEYAHDEPLHFAFELGAGSLFLLALFVRSLSGRLELERMLLVAVFIEGLLSFPLHMPVTAFLAALLAGRLARARADARDSEHGGGVAAWIHADEFQAFVSNGVRGAGRVCRTAFPVRSQLEKVPGDGRG